jgi:hypothetical protein
MPALPFTRVALNRGAKQVIAIEPAPENLECLSRNFSREIQSGKVVIYPKGVWNKDDVLPMDLNRNSAGDSFVINSGIVSHRPRGLVAFFAARQAGVRCDPGQQAVLICHICHVKEVLSEIGFTCLGGSCRHSSLRSNLHETPYRPYEAPALLP